MPIGHLGMKTQNKCNENKKMLQMPLLVYIIVKREQIGIIILVKVQFNFSVDFLKGRHDSAKPIYLS